MKRKGLITTVLISGIILCAFSAPLSFSQEEQRPTVIIPPQVKTVFQEGMQSREARVDIPFQITNALFLPAGQNLHAVIVFISNIASAVRHVPLSLIRCDPVG